MRRFISKLMILLGVAIMSSCSGETLHHVQIVESYYDIISLKDNTPPDGAKIVVELLNNDAATKALFQSNDRMKAYTDDHFDEIDYKKYSLLAVYKYTATTEWATPELSLDSKVLTVTCKEVDYYISAPLPSRCTLYKITPSMKGCSIKPVIIEKQRD